jgi:hypothetical protein
MGLFNIPKINEVNELFEPSPPKQEEEELEEESISFDEYMKRKKISNQDMEMAVEIEKGMINKMSKVSSDSD